MDMDLEDMDLGPQFTKKKSAHLLAKGNRTTLPLHEFCLAAGFLASSRQMPLRLTPFALKMHYTHHMHTLTFVRSTALFCLITRSVDVCTTLYGSE